MKTSTSKSIAWFNIINANFILSDELVFEDCSGGVLGFVDFRSDGPSGDSSNFDDCPSPVSSSRDFLNDNRSSRHHSLMLPSFPRLGFPSFLITLAVDSSFWTSPSLTEGISSDSLCFCASFMELIDFHNQRPRLEDPLNFR